MPRSLPPAQVTAADIRKAEIAAQASLKAQQAVQQANIAKEEQQREMLNAMPSDQAAEVRARAEHMKQQRDLILAKRKKQYEVSGAATATEPAAPTPPAPAQALRRGAGYSSAAAAPPVGMSDQQLLSRSLASNMKASLLGGNAADGLGASIAAAERRADLEATKNMLRAERDSLPEF